MQSALITKHLLFVGTPSLFPSLPSLLSLLSLPTQLTVPISGFSLIDANWKSILKAVDDSVSNYAEKSRILGTSLQLIAKPELSKSYEQSINMCFMDQNETSKEYGRAARRLEIFLDRISLSSSTNVSFLGVPQFASLLSEDEMAVRDSIRKMIESIPESAKTTEAYRILMENLLENFGDSDERKMFEKLYEMRRLNVSLT